jgi:glutamate--cysteine ligase
MRTHIISELDGLLQREATAISQWFDAEFHKTPAPFYASVDLRHSGHKIVPVDTNLFPAGFNNLSPLARQRAAIGFKRYLLQHFPDTQRLLLLAENHTRNLGYLENIAVLAEILRAAGLEVVIGRTEGDAPLELTTLSGQQITEYPVQKQGNLLHTSAGFIPQVIVVNNDFTSGIPEILQDIKQPMIPSPELGWHSRRKHQHFRLYGQVANEFATQFRLDCWKIWTIFDEVAALNFKERSGVDLLVERTREVLIRIAHKYEAYGIEEEPYVFIKANAGTYGMGIMTVRDPEELRDLNKKDRNKMHAVKEGAQVSEVIIQEGIPTIDKVENDPAEPMIYCVGGHAIGGAFRVNRERDAYGNLNAAGMYFTGICELVEKPTHPAAVVLDECNFSVYSLIARLANLAAAREAAHLVTPLPAVLPAGCG